MRSLTRGSDTNRKKPCPDSGKRNPREEMYFPRLAPTVLSLPVSQFLGFSSCFGSLIGSSSCAIGNGEEIDEGSVAAVCEGDSVLGESNGILWIAHFWIG